MSQRQSRTLKYRTTSWSVGSCGVKRKKGGIASSKNPSKILKGYFAEINQQIEEGRERRRLFRDAHLLKLPNYMNA